MVHITASQVLSSPHPSSPSHTPSLPTFTPTALLPGLVDMAESSSGTMALPPRSAALIKWLLKGALGTSSAAILQQQKWLLLSKWAPCGSQIQGRIGLPVDLWFDYNYGHGMKLFLQDHTLHPWFPFSVPDPGPPQVLQYRCAVASTDSVPTVSAIHRYHGHWDTY